MRSTYESSFSQWRVVSELVYFEATFNVGRFSAGLCFVCSWYGCILVAWATSRGIGNYQDHSQIVSHD
jgi:hypothetical protein